jgi:hypothetical protein
VEGFSCEAGSSTLLFFQRVLYGTYRMYRVYHYHTLHCTGRPRMSQSAGGTTFKRTAMTQLACSNALFCEREVYGVVLYKYTANVTANGSLSLERRLSENFPTNSDKFVNFPTNFNTFRRMTFRRFYIPTKLKTFRQTSTLSEE